MGVTNCSYGGSLATTNAGPVVALTLFIVYFVFYIDIAVLSLSSRLFFFLRSGPSTSSESRVPTSWLINGTIFLWLGKCVTFVVLYFSAMGFLWTIDSHIIKALLLLSPQVCPQRQK